MHQNLSHEAAPQKARPVYHNFTPEAVIQIAEAFGICPRGFRMDEPSVARSWGVNKSSPWNEAENAKRVSQAAEIMETNFLPVEDYERAVWSDRLADAVSGLGNKPLVFSGHVLVAAALLGLRIWPGNGGRDGVIGLGRSHPLLQGNPK